MKKSTKILIASAVILGASGGVFAFGKHHNHWKFSPEEKAAFVTERVVDKLTLDDSQQLNLQAFVEEVLDSMEEIKADRETHMAEIEALLAEPAFDQGRALQMIQSKTQQISDRAPAAIASLAVFLDSLNTEQKAQVQSFAAKGMNHARGHSGYYQ